MQWRNDAIVSPGVRARAFVVARDGDAIPGTLWTPEHAAGPLPLVLLGHGAQSDCRDAGNVAFAASLIARHAVAVASIDAIDHGERGPIRADGAALHPAFVALWQRPGTFDRMAADWSATLDALVDGGVADPACVAYRGLSMGTMLGLPFVGAEPRIRAAVLGACGLTGMGARAGGFAERHRADAPRVTCPVLFLMKWHDEVFDRDGCLALFDLIGSPDKRAHAFPGGHALYPAESIDAALAFLAQHLGLAPAQQPAR